MSNAKHSCNVLSLLHCFRHITIYGCDVGVFQTFLGYLYSGSLDTEAMSLDEVIEVLAVADQYETTSLRLLCEGVLVSRVEDSNVFFLLQVADRFSARKLRVRCLSLLSCDILAQSVSRVPRDPLAKYPI